MIYIQFLQALSEQKTENSPATDNALIQKCIPTEFLMNSQKNGKVLNKQERTNDYTLKHRSLITSTVILLSLNEKIIKDHSNNLFNHLQ